MNTDMHACGMKWETTGSSGYTAIPTTRCSPAGSLGQVAPRAVQDEWGIYISDCYASNKNRPAGLHGQAITATVEQLVRNVFVRHAWYLGTTNGIPLMTDPKRRYQDQCTGIYQV